MNLIDFYTNYDENNRLTRNKARRLEYLTTIDRIKPYVTKSAKILELGAAFGAYTEYLVDAGAAVLATDIVPMHVDFLAERFGPRPKFRSMVLDARVLSPLGDERYDLILNLGPHYHLQSRDERLDMLRQCKARLNPDGILAVAYINKHFVFPLYYKTGKAPNAEQAGLFAGSEFDKLGGFDEFTGFSHFTTPEEIEAEAKDAGLSIKENVATDGFYGFLADSIEKLDEGQFGVLVRHHLATCATRSVIGASNHGLLLCEAAT